MDDKKTGWGVFIVGAAVFVVALAVLLYLHAQHPGALVKFADGHRESLKSLSHWKAPTYAAAAAAIAGVIVAVVGLAKAQRGSDD
jgi:hypothetical protein